MSLCNPPASPLWSNRILALFRIVAGLMLLSTGTMMLFGFPHSPKPMPPFALTSQIGIGKILETMGGLAIALGLCTRPVAFVLSGEMAVAYFQFHAPKSFFPTVNGGASAILYCFFFLYLAFAGAGAWSLDEIIFRTGKNR